MQPILEPIHLDEQRTITSFYHSKKNFETPWHFHPQHELTYIEESVGTKFVGDYVGPYEPGELVLLRSNLPHCWKNNTEQTGLSKSIVVQWNLGVFPKVPELESLFQLLRTASKGILFDKEATAPLISQLKKCPKLGGHDLYIQLLTLLVKLADCDYTPLSSASFIDDLPSEYGNRMADIHDFVGMHYNRKIYLKELADLVNMSEQSFSRFFTKMMGRPFFTFLNEYRINISARMLLDTHDSVSHIAFACGYESLPFFHRQFKKFMGCSPLAYQRKYTKV
ncbi:AraC family transcriptional regulator [Zobellia sp. OII3]|uniref:AraC family transcriptional regulator n=1 Tax=Zobellia sp. OII3 TaxID=2034520 RepID=UPI000B533B3F|nr:AraC family transcriptional regulator [Zobellia sp. OII3]OWW24964.1 AraC family transcriptional regulator [Zobellia sp. OII3]